MVQPAPKRSDPVFQRPPPAVGAIGFGKILEWAGHESGIDADLQRSFEIGDALKLECDRSVLGRD